MRRLVYTSLLHMFVNLTLIHFTAYLRCIKVDSDRAHESGRMLIEASCLFVFVHARTFGPGI